MKNSQEKLLWQHSFKSGLEGAMQPINCFPFVQIGSSVQKLLDCLGTSEKYTFNDLARDGALAAVNLNMWASDTLFSARLSKPEAALIARGLATLMQSEYLQQHGTAGVPDRQALVDSLNHFMIILQAECSAADSYYVTEKRNWDTKGLIFVAERDIDEPFRSILPWECVEDIRAAGKCIAFELPTAVGFHICRAVETALFLYFGVLDISLKGVKNPGMGTYLCLIKDKGVDTAIIDELQKIRKLRNDLMHPDVVLESGEAQDFFQQTLKTITVMAKDMVRRQPLLLRTPEEMENVARAAKAEKTTKENIS